MPKWEYFELSEPNVERMNKLGAMGWELVACTDFNGMTWRAIFKRPMVKPESVEGVTSF